MNTKIIFIDNFDSFSYNLTDNLKVLGQEVTVMRNDVSLELLDRTLKSLSDAETLPIIFLSPGPSHPKDANQLLKIIELYLGKYPFLGVCLGHQALGLVLGGAVARCPEIVHGQSSVLLHNGRACFKDLPNPLTVGRYHSLYVEKVPNSVEELATCSGFNMAMYSKSLNFLSVQFHPESILTAFGPVILEQALKTVEEDYCTKNAH